MKALSWIVAGVLCSSSAYATAVEGLQLQTRPEDGKPNLGVHYAYDSSAAWTIIYTTTLTPQKVAGLPKKIQVMATNEATGEILFPWMEVPVEVLTTGTFGIRERAVLKKLLASLPKMVLTYGIPDSAGKIEPKYFLNVGALCKSAPTHFVDLTRGKTGCDVKMADLDEMENECKELAEEFLGYVKSGASCAAAKKSYANLGCGELNCK